MRRVHDLEATRHSLQVRLAAAESRIRELEESKEQKEAYLEGRCREAESHVKELEAAMQVMTAAHNQVMSAAQNRKKTLLTEDEIVKMTSGIAELFKQVQIVEHVLDITNSRASTMRSEIKMVYMDEIFKLREQLQDKEREVEKEASTKQRDIAFGWNEMGADQLINNIHNTKQHPATIVKQQFAGIVSLASRSLESQTYLCDRGAAEAIFAAIKAHEDAPDVLVFGFAALAALSHGSQNNSRRVGESGAVEVVLAAMRLHVSHAGVSEQACWTLADLAAHNEDNRRRILDNGGVGQVVAAMRSHKEIAHLQVTGCAALSAIVFSTQGGPNLVKEQGCIEAVLSCMQEHNTLPAVQEQACKAITSLAKCGDVLSLRMGDLGATECITKAMRDHSNPQVQERNSQNSSCPRSFLLHIMPLQLN